MGRLHAEFRRWMVGLAKASRGPLPAERWPRFLSILLAPYQADRHLFLEPLQSGT